MSITDAKISRNADNLHDSHAASREWSDSGSNNVADEKEEEPLSAPQLNLDERIFRKMSYTREIVFLILAFAAVCVRFSPPPKVSKPPSARPFFNQTSIVLDFYQGHLGAMVDRVTTSDFSFIMFYAPWDAESQAVREEFEIVAKYYHSQVFFAAINCWHPGSDCRTHYNKIQSYPVLMLYPARDSGVQYKGILTAPYIIRFLDSFMNPIVRVSNQKQVTQLLVEHDAVFLGFFDFNGLAKSPGYKEFHKAAIRYLERDPNRDVMFSVITNTKSAQADFGVFHSPGAALFMWNETLIFPEDKEWTSENLFQWLENSLHRVALWLQPPGSKSLTLAPFLWNGPVLFLFTPRSPLLSSNYNYDLLKEVGLDYYSCDVNLIRDEIISGLREKRANAEISYRDELRKCSALLTEDKVHRKAPVISISLQNWINDSCCSRIVMNKCLLCEKKGSAFLNHESEICTVSVKNNEKVCRGTDILYPPLKPKDQERYEYCCAKDKDDKETSFHSENFSKQSHAEKEIDPLSSESIKQHFHREKCRQFLTGNNHQSPIFPKDEGDESANLKDVKCRSNRTLLFVAIDSSYYYHFANNLGVDVLSRRDKTAVIIVDPLQESQYTMQEDLNRGSLIRFISNYMHGLLQRNLRSENSRHLPSKRETDKRCEGNNSSGVCVTELTTETFLPTILDPSRDVVVMYHSPYCAFCSAVGYVFLTVAHYLSKMDNLRFVRVDGDHNDLPWEYSMNRYPSILFFPARRKEDSTVFPFSLPITIANLANFVLANLEEDSHIDALINICHFGAGESPEECVARIRLLCLDVIESHLRRYRKLRRHASVLGKRRFGNERRQILVKLNHVRDVHLVLKSVNDLGKEKTKVRLLRQKFRGYYGTLSVIRNGNNVETVDENRTMKILRDEL